MKILSEKILEISIGESNINRGFGSSSMNFNATDAREFAKERKEGLDSATFAETFASFAFNFQFVYRQGWF
jgi:hypothetical protein